MLLAGWLTAGWLTKANAAESNGSVTMQPTWSFSYKWFAVESKGKHIAYVDADCKIVELYPLDEYKYLKAELERYAGMCRDYNKLEKEIKEIHK